jgi:hypothetical protein
VSARHDELLARLQGGRNARTSHPGRGSEDRVWGWRCGRKVWGEPLLRVAFLCRAEAPGNTRPPRVTPPRRVMTSAEARREATHCVAPSRKGEKVCVALRIFTASSRIMSRLYTYRMPVRRNRPSHAPIILHSVRLPVSLALWVDSTMELNTHIHTATMPCDCANVPFSRSHALANADPTAKRVTPVTNLCPQSNFEATLRVRRVLGGRPR